VQLHRYKGRGEFMFGPLIRLLMLAVLMLELRQQVHNIKKELDDKQTKG